MTVVGGCFTLGLATSNVVKNLYAADMCANHSAQGCGIFIDIIR